MDQKSEYEVTQKAGAFVAGVRSPGEGKRLQLTAEQAHHAVRAGELKLIGPVAPIAPAPVEAASVEPVSETETEAPRGRRQKTAEA